MSYNDGAQIVPIRVLQGVISQIAPGAIFLPPYARVQLLTESAMKQLVLDYFDATGISYGSESPDFPLCEDFSDEARVAVKRGARLAGLAVRPAFGNLDYIRKTPPSHSINWAVVVGGEILYYEPQTQAWLDAPADFQSFYQFRL